MLYRMSVICVFINTHTHIRTCVGKKELEVEKNRRNPKMLTLRFY